MNLHEYLDAIKAGGPGSGCHGPNCGRPLGHGGRHIPEGGKKSFVEQRHDEKLAKKAFNKARRALNRRVKDFRYTGGEMTNKERREMKKAGALVDIKKKGLVLKTDIARVTDTKVERVTITSKNPRTGKEKTRTFKVEVETIRPIGAIPTPKMGVSRGRNIVEGPPQKAHSLWGKFSGAIKIDVKEENRRTLVFDAARDDQGRGATVFVHKETEGNKSRVVIQEVKRGEHGHIEETRQYKFGSGKAGKDFLAHRYGLKKVRWTG